VTFQFSRIKLLLLFSISLLAVHYPSMVQAQLLTDQAVVGAVGAASAGALYGAAKEINKPGDPILPILQNQGYLSVSRDPSSPARYMAIDPRDGPVILTVDPATGRVIFVAQQ
jgi:hypothetical protein